MKAAVRWIIAICFLSRLTFYMQANFHTFAWKEVYYFFAWFILLAFTFLTRYLVGETNISQATKKILKSELFKLALLFVLLILWEILNCISSSIAHTDFIYWLMLVLTALIIAWMILSTKQ